MKGRNIKSIYNKKNPPRTVCDHARTEHPPVCTTTDHIHTISGATKIEEKHTGNTIKTILALWMTIVTLNNTILTQW